MGDAVAATHTPAFTGRLLLAKGRHHEAVQSLHRYLDQHPTSAYAAFYLGIAFIRLRRDDEALETLTRAAQMDPTHAPTWAHIGRVHHHTERFADALAAYDTSLTLAPEQADVLVLAGNAAWELQDMARAANYYVRASACPSTPEGDYNLSRIYLQRGDYALGFRLHEQRLACAHYLGAQGQGRAWYGTARQWGGGECHGTLLIHGEQGNGDILQMLRFVPWACERTSHVVLEVPRSMVRLCREAFPDVTVIARGDTLPPWDEYCPTMSLPYLYGIDTPVDVPPPALGALPRWHDGFSLYLGVCWRGSPDHPRDKHRSMSEAAFLDAVCDVLPVRRFVLDPRVDPDLRDYLDTARIIRNLGLVVTVDTSVAHLAGALGCPTFLLLDHFPDWRWGLSGHTTPWYPSVRLFRQPAPGDWASVIAEMRAALEEEP